jgi:hypothetical protein
MGTHEPGRTPQRVRQIRRQEKKKILNLNLVISKVSNYPKKNLGSNFWN